MGITAIVQARTGSTRLPHKVLRPLGSTSVLGQVIHRLRRCRKLDQVVVATTVSDEDRAIVDEADRFDVTVVRGSECDVLSRYELAARQVDATVIIRVTSDCPLIDPQVVDQIVARYLESQDEETPLDYVCNFRPRTFPHGLDAEVFSRKLLDVAHVEAKQSFEREHVTPFFYLNPERFHIGNVSQSVDQSHHRWTLDEPRDYQFFEAVFAAFPNDHLISTRDVLNLIEQRPELAQINADVQQKKLPTS